MKHLLFFILLLSISLSAYAAPDGKKLYDNHCSICHNKKGLGGIGAPLTPAKVVNYSDDFIFKTIRLGRKGRVMPAFDHLSDSQVNAIIEYIKSWNKVSKTIIFSDQKINGDVENGKKIYQEKCQSCHGESGKSNALGTGVTISRQRDFKIVPPDLGNPGYLASANDAFIKNSIISGQLGSAMPTLDELALSDKELDDVVSFIRSFENVTKDEIKPETQEPTLIFDSPYDFDTTVTNLKNALTGLNFRYFPDRYLEMGLGDEKDMNKKQMTLRFCNFKDLYDMINMDPRLGIFLPCQITVVENEEGSVQLYLMNMTLISKLFNNDQLTVGAQEMHEIMLEVIDEATL